MKKFCSLLLAVMLTLSLAACGQSEANEITKLYQDGYTSIMSSANETMYAALFEKDESLILVTAPLNTGLYEKLSAIEFDDEEGIQAFLGDLDEFTTLDVSSDKPTDEALNQQYAGKTFADLLDDGYERTGYCEGDDSCIFYFDGPEFSLSVTTEEKISVADLDDYSENALKLLTIQSVTFNGFSSYYLDQYTENN